MMVESTPDFAWTQANAMAAGVVLCSCAMRTSVSMISNVRSVRNAVTRSPRPGCTSSLFSRVYFPVKLPVALEAERAVFVYVDPGHDTTTALRSWAVAHRGLWEALRERGRSIEVVAVVRTLEEFARARAILESWTNTSTASRPSAAPEPDSAARREIVRIEQAIRAKDDWVLKEYGDLQACLKRMVELSDLHRSSTPGTLIHGFAAWRSRRLPGGEF